MNIYDIANRCSVSIATVSRVLNGSPNVSPRTRERVLEVMREEGYTPNAFARGLGLNSMNMVGLLCTDVSDVYYAKAVSLLENDLRQKGFDSLLCCTGNHLKDKKKSLQLLLAKHVDAVILIGSAFQESTDNSHIANAAKQVPIVIINGFVELPNTYCVLCEERSAMRENISALFRQGYSRILYLYDALTYSGRVKLEGYRDALRLHGLDPSAELVVRSGKSVSGASRITANLLDAGENFSAVAASEDLLAIGALQELSRRGLDIPVIGFNNSILAECSSPPLTSVDNMLDELCPAAVNLLADLLEGKPVSQVTTIPAKLVERSTFRKNLS